MKFAEKFGEKICVFVQTTASFCKNVGHNIAFLEKNANFFAEDCGKN
jgi:hypothetical protein